MEGHASFPSAVDVGSETQQVAFIGTVRENLQSRGANTGDGSVVAIGPRLKVVDGLITEVEQLAIRPENTGGRGRGAAPRGAGAGAPAPAAGGARGTGAGPSSGEAGNRVEAMKEPHPIFRETIPAAKRPSREELVETANHGETGEVTATTGRDITRSPTTVCVLRPRADQLDLAARRALQDRERPDSPRRGGFHSRALRDAVGLEHVRTGDVGIDPKRPVTTERRVSE